jgi:leader peptidase (prepilin peptidase)/N-methyltransferase
LERKARCRGRKLEFQNIFSEILTAVLFLLLWGKFGPWEFWAYGILFGLLIVASGIDVLTMNIPDRCSVGGAILGILGNRGSVGGAILCILGNRCSVVASEKRSIGTFFKRKLHFFGGTCSLQGMLLGSSALLWIAIFAELILSKEAIGFGDVKLMGCIGAFLGTKAATFSIFGGTCLGMVTIFPI